MRSSVQVKRADDSFAIGTFHLAGIWCLGRVDRAERKHGKAKKGSKPETGSHDGSSLIRISIRLFSAA